MSRVRRRPTVTSTLAGYYAMVNDNTGYEYPTQPFTIYSRTIDEYMVDEVIPNYKERSQAGEIFNNPLFSEKIIEWCVPTYGVQSIVNGESSTTTRTLMDLGYVAGCPPPWGIDGKKANLIRAVSTKAMSKVSSEEIQIYATLGELKETKDMLLKTAVKLRYLRPILRRYRDILQYIHWSKGKRKLLTKLYLDLENIWMEIRMGWRPFYHECNSLHEAMTSLKENPKRKTFRTGANTTFTNAQNNVTWDIYSRIVTGSKTYSEDYAVYAGVLCEQRYAGVPDTYGLTKIPQSIWELTTLSWCIDYFFNVGELIAAYTPDTLWKVLSAWYTERSEKLLVNQVTRAEFANASPPLKNGYRAQLTKTVKRTPGTSLGIAFRPRMNWAKYIDSIAVARQHIAPLVKQCLNLSKRNRKR